MPGRDQDVPVQGYLVHTKPPFPLGPPYGPTHRPTVGSWGGAFSHERGTPVLKSGRDEDVCGRDEGVSVLMRGRDADGMRRLRCRKCCG